MTMNLPVRGQVRSTLVVCDHPLIRHKLTRMRDKNCASSLFRRYLREISMIMASDVTRGLQTESIEIETPLTKTQGDRIAGAPPLVVPVLRAGLTMAEGFLDVMPEAVVGHIGVYRDHDTKRPVEYLVKLPEAMGQKVFVVDPMLATGYSAAHAFQCLIKAGFHPDQCAMVALVGAPEGVRVFQENFPDVPVYLAALDEKLNDDAYIVPGLGDAGDRLFGS